MDGEIMTLTKEQAQQCLLNLKTKHLRSNFTYYDIDGTIIFQVKDIENNHKSYLFYIVLTNPQKGNYLRFAVELPINIILEQLEAKLIEAMDTFIGQLISYIDYSKIPKINSE